MKKLQTRLAYSLLAVWTFTFIISLFPSCEIGLGGAVDTQPPSLTITNPKVDSVIRDKFLISGTWSDDGSLFSVKATLSRTDGKGKTVEIDGSFTQEERQGGSWQVLVDYREKNLIDGTYQASIAVKDKSGRITTQNTTFTIDNTAPVLVLSRPSIKDGQSGFDSYGRSFTLEGKAADDNDVSHIEVNIYENADSTEPMKTIGLDNVPLTIEQDVAIYEADKANDYSEIYGHTDENGIIFAGSDKTEQRYCTITIYDGAERFPVDGSAQTEEDKKGNSTNVYYMNSEIATLLQGKYKITDLYHIMNGNYGTDESRAASAEDIITLLEPYKVSKSKFSINPANNPKYILSSGNVLEEGKNLNNVDYQFTAGNRYIEVEIRPGLDGYPIDPDTVGVYLLECDEDGNPKNDEKIWLINTGADYHKTQEEVDTQGLDLDSGFGVYTVSGSTYKFKTSKMIHKTNYSVNTGHYYLVQVQGNDSQGESSGSIISDGTFAFKLVSNEEKIELSAHGVPDYLSKKAEAWAVAGHEAFTVTLNWATGEGPFKVYRQNGSGEDLVATVSEPTNGVWEAAESFNYSQLKALGSGDAFPEKLAYYLKNNSGDIISTTARINLKYDSAEPSITNVQFSNSYYKEDIKTYFVRNVADNLSNINGIATDDTGIEKVELKVGDTTVKSWPDGRFKFENVEFSGYTESGITANIVATDVAGNQKTYPLTIVFDKEAPAAKHEPDAKGKDIYFNVTERDNDDISEANPRGLTWNKVTINGKLYEGIDTEVGGKYGAGTYSNGGTIKIKGAFDDNGGSGVKMIYYKIYDRSNPLTYDSVNNEERHDITSSELESLKNDVLNNKKYFAPLTAPLYKRVFYNVAKDSTDKYGGTLLGNVSDYTNKDYYKYWKLVENTYEATISGFNEGSNYLVLVAEDNVGNTALNTALIDFQITDDSTNPPTTTIEQRVYSNTSMNVDSRGPEIIVPAQNDIVYTNGGELYLTVEVIDPSPTDINGQVIENACSGVDTVQFTVERAGITYSVDAEKVQGEDNKWKANVQNILPDTQTGTSTIRVIAKDVAGTSSKVDFATVTIDKKVPTVTFNSPAANLRVNKTVTLSGTVSDGNGAGVNTEIEPVLYWTTNATEKRTNPDPTALAEKAADGWVQLASGWDTTTTEDLSDWKFAIDTTTLKPDGTNVITDGTDVYFTVSAKDKAGSGNTGYATAHALVVDQNSDRPTIKFTNVPIATTMGSASPIWITKQEIYGTVQDDDGQIQSVHISFDYEAKTTAQEEPTWTSCYTVQDGLHYSFPLDGSLDGTQVIYFKVVDAVGTPFVSSVVTDGNPDTNAPVLAYQDTAFGNTTGKYSSVLYANIDFQDPTIPCIYYSEEDFSNVDNSAELAALFDEGNYRIPADTSKWKDLSTLSKPLGGTKNIIYVLVKAVDANGIDTIASTFGQNTCSSIITNEIDTTNEKSMAALYCLNVSAINEVTVLKLSFAATDKASHTHTSIYDISIDNVAPQVVVDRPTPNSEIYGTEGVPANNITVSGRTSDANSVAKIYMTYTKGGTEKPAKPADNAIWVDITRQTALTWSVVFDKKNMQNYEQEDMYVYHTDLFNNIVNDLYGPNTTTTETEKEICLWFYAEDELGNNGKNAPLDLPLNILTQGDKPTVSVSYPTQDITVGGVITISGGTSIATSTVSEIWLQIDPDFNGSFDSEWETNIQALISGYTEEELGYKIENILDSENNIKGKGIKADGSKQSWNKIINMASEFVKYKTDNNGNFILDENNKKIKINRDIAVRVYAMSETGKVSEPVTVSFTLDPESPTFGNNEPLTLVQYLDDDPAKAITASKLYENGMWIQGKWWLTGSVEDESGIEYVKINNTETLSSNYYTEVSTANFKGYRLNIPVGKPKNSETTYGPEFSLFAKEKEGSKTSPFDIKFNYDNNAPEFESTTLSSDQENATTLRQSDGVCEIKGTYSDGATGSGFERIIFYVTRTLTRQSITSKYITDIMALQGNNGIDNCLKISTTEGTVHNESKLYLDSGLYWKKIEGCSAQNNIEIVIPTAKVSEIPAFLKKGGVCRINDIIYRIEDITDGQNNSKIITIDNKITSSNNVTVEFAHAQVIEHTLYESGVTTYYGDTSHIIRNDDDDEMQESVVESAGTWSVSINSKNITDGTIEVHFVAFDKAGNQTEKTYYASVANNAPRLAGIKFGTDVNGNEQVDEDELRHEFSGLYWVGKPNQKPNVSLNGHAANGEPINVLALPNDGTYISEIDQEANAIMTVKGGITIIPEIVGGNYGISWNYTVGNKIGTRWNSSTSTWSNASASTVWELNSNHGDTDDVRDAATTTISLSTLELLKNTTEGLNTLGFKLWDHTEGTTPGVNSNYAQLLIKVNVALNDSEIPTAGIKPFYWKSADENSLAYDTKGKPMGHIELENDLPVEGFDFAGTDGPEFDLDPKVSGVIYLEGFAKDNVAVEKLRIKIDGSGFSYTDAQNAENNQNYSTAFGVIAMRDRRNNSSTKGKLISIPSLSSNGLEFDSYREETVKDGNNEYNLVHWKIKIDTSKITTAAQTNVLIQVKAEDRGSATLKNSDSDYDYLNPKTSAIPDTFVLAKNQTGYMLGENGSVVMENSRPTYNSENQTPSYRIDIVPYIAKVYTYLGKLKNNNWSVYNRTALGHYAVAADEKIYLYGFNLGNGTYQPKYNTTTLDAPVNGTIQQIEDGKTVCPYGGDYAAYGVVPFPVVNVTTSGQIDITVNSIKTLNNMNNTGAKGSSTKTTTNVTGDKSVYDDYYNRQPNGDNNNLLTDDVVLDVWDIDPTAVKPKSGTASQPVMAINPVNNQIGFAFVNGSLYYSMAAGTPGANNTTATTPNSYEYWVGGIDFWTSVGFAYDQKGHSFGTVAGGDINSGKADMFRIFTSYWGKGWLHNNGYRNGQNQFRLELVGQKDFEGSGTSYAAFDNFNKERIKSPSITTVSTSDNTTTVYLAYYDEINDEIRFKWGNFGDERKKPSALFIDYYGEHHNDKSGTNDTGWDNSGYDSVIGNKNLKEYTLDYISLIAGHTEDKVTATNGTKVSKIVKSKANKDVYAGKYVSIVALPSQGDSDDAVIAIWWDGTNNQMLYSYNLKPQSITAGTYTHSQTGWSEPKAIFGEGSGIGEYCKVVADKNNHIHIACYDGLNGDLYYAYIDNFQEPQNAKTCIVDSYGIIGTEIGIDVGLKSVLDEEGNPVLENGNPKYITVPYISYYAGSTVRPKIASWAGEANIKDSNIFAGADNEAFTGCWDVSLIPTGSRVSNDHVNVGLWKDDGVIKDSVANTNTHTPGMGHTNSYGTVWGNGTANPVLGYAVTKGANGYIETAQMK